MTFIIAEIGVNHNGDFNSAMRMIELAKESGADAAKFQLFKGRPEIEHLRFTENQITLLHSGCHALGIEFMCTPFYLSAVEFLDPLVKRHKIASSWVHNREILGAAIETGKQVIVSMGMAKAEDHLGLYWRENISLLHCVSKYPCPDEEARLEWITGPALSGYSDHTVGTVACIAAVAIGARIIEKHFTLDKTQDGPDHACSAEPDEFAQMVRDIRRVEKML